MTARTKYLEPNASEEVFDLIPTADSFPARNLEIANVAPARRLYANVLGVQVEAVDMAAALSRIETALITRRKGYICLAGVHGIMEAQRNPAVKDAFADAYMTLPDGTPTAWVGRMQGLRWMSRLTGPDLMLEVFRRKQFAQYRHFLYGGKPGVAQELAANLCAAVPLDSDCGHLHSAISRLDGCAGEGTDSDDMQNEARYRLGRHQFAPSGDVYAEVSP